MRIEKVEKVILTEKEADIINEALNIIEKVYALSITGEKLEKEINNLMEALNDFCDEIEIEIN